MQKEKLTISNIAKDLKISSAMHGNVQKNARAYYMQSALVLMLGIWIFTESLLLGVATSLFFVYHAVYYIIERKAYWQTKKKIMRNITRGDLSVSVEQFSHMVTETIYEPHSHGRSHHSTEEVRFIYFTSGGSWRVPEIRKHYAWSREYFLSTKGIDNISLPGDEFFYISIKGDHSIAYVYPCKFFELDENLKKSVSVT